MLWKSIAILSGVLLCYILLSATVFHYLEQPNEISVKEKTRDFHMEFLRNFSCINSGDMEIFVERLMAAYDMGVVATANKTSVTNWDFASAIFFTLTVVTTIATMRPLRSAVTWHHSLPDLTKNTWDNLSQAFKDMFGLNTAGYGNIAPTTLAGQVFCILCALCGIPLCTVFLAAIGQKLRYPITKLQERLVTNRSHRVCRCVKFCLCVLLGSTLLILLPSIMFTLVEGWHYGESVYYTVITLTTIGFGDYVAGLKAVPHREIYRAVAAVWVTLGLAWVALLISEMTGDINDKIVKKEKKCCTEHVSKQDELQMASLES